MQFEGCHIMLSPVLLSCRGCLGIERKSTVVSERLPDSHVGRCPISLCHSLSVEYLYEMS